MAGKIYITVLEARRLPKQDLVTKSDPYCVISYEGQEARTPIVDDSQDPVWNHKIQFVVGESNFSMAALEIAVRDKKLVKDREIGVVRVPLNVLVGKPPKTSISNWYALEKKEDKKKKDLGELHLSISHDPNDNTEAVADVVVDASANKKELLDKVTELQSRLEECRTDRDDVIKRVNELFFEQYLKYCNPQELGKLSLTIVSGRDLVKKDMFGGSAKTLLEGTSDPYCKITCGGGPAKISAVIKNSLNPIWNQDFQLPVMHVAEELVIDVFDKDPIGKDEFMGQVRVPLLEHIPNLADKDGAGNANTPLVDLSFPLQPSKFQSAKSATKVKGSLQVKFFFTPNSDKSKQTDVVIRGKADIFNMAQQVRDNLLKRIAASEEEADRAQSLMREIETIFTKEYFTWCKPINIAVLRVQVKQARDLPKHDIIGSSDPFIVIEVETQKVQTPVISNSLNPVWDSGATFDLPLTRLKSSRVSLTCYDYDVVGHSSLMGTSSLDVSEIYELTGGGQKEWDTWVNLRVVNKGKKEEAGAVRLLISYIPNQLGEQSGDASGKSKNEILDIAKDVRDTLIRNIEERDKKIESSRDFLRAIEAVFAGDWAELLKEKGGNRDPKEQPIFAEDDVLSMAQSVHTHLYQKIENLNTELKVNLDFIRQIDQIFSADYFTYCDVRPIGDVIITVKEGKDLAKRDLIGSSDPFLVVDLENHHVQSDIVKNNLNPKWKEASWKLGVTTGTGVLQFQVFDYDRLSNNNFLGLAQVLLRDFIKDTSTEQLYEQWLTLGPKFDNSASKSNKKEKISGSIHVSITYKPRPKDSVTEEQHGNSQILTIAAKVRDALHAKLSQAEAERQAARNVLDEIEALFRDDYLAYCADSLLANIDVQVVQARGLAIKDVSSSDPYVMVEYGGKRVKTEVINSNLNPVWKDANFTLPVTRLEGAIIMKVMDYDMVGEDDFMGYKSILIDDVIKNTQGGEGGVVWESWFQLEVEPSEILEKKTKSKKNAADDVVSGQVLLRIKFTPLRQPETKAESTPASQIVGMLSKVREAFLTRLTRAEHSEREASKFVHQVDLVFIEEYYKLCKPQPVAELKVQVVEAKNLPKKDFFGGCDPFVVLSIENSKAQTDIIKKTVNPNWGNTLYTLPITNLYGSLNVHVYDWDAIGKNDSVGKVDIPVQEVISHTLIESSQQQQAWDQWFTLTKDGEEQGSIRIVIACQPIKIEQGGAGVSSNAAEVMQHVKGVKEALIQRADEAVKFVNQVKQIVDEEQTALKSLSSSGSLIINVVGARNLIAADIVSSSSDPYCVINLSNSTQKTKVIKNNLNPKWNASFTLPVTDAKVEILEILVMDYDLIGRDEFLGVVTMPLQLLEPEKKISDWFKLCGYKKYKAQGELCLEIEYTTHAGAHSEKLLIDLGDLHLAAKPDAQKLADVDKDAVFADFKDLVKGYKEHITALEKQLKKEREEKVAAVARVDQIASVVVQKDLKLADLENRKTLLDRLRQK